MCFVELTVIRDLVVFGPDVVSSYRRKLSVLDKMSVSNSDGCILDDGIDIRDRGTNRGCELLDKDGFTDVALTSGVRGVELGQFIDDVLIMLQREVFIFRFL